VELNHHILSEAVLKTAGLPFANIHIDPLQFDHARSDSGMVRRCPQASMMLAVFLAVTNPDSQGLLKPKVHGSTPARAPKNATSRPVAITACVVNLRTEYQNDLQELHM